MYLIDIAQQVALSFTKTEDFIGKPNKNKMARSNSQKSNQGDRIEKEIKKAYIISEGDEVAFYII